MTIRSSILFGIPFSRVSVADSLDWIGERIRSRKPSFIVTPNLDFAMQAAKDVELQNLLIDADLSLCDGMPIFRFARWAGSTLPEKVSGSDLVPLIFERASREGWRLFLLGASDEVLRTVARRMEREFPGAILAGRHSPPIAPLAKYDHAGISRMIEEARPDLLLVGLGCPKQEKLIAMMYRKLGVPVSIGIGASLDFMAGKVRRSPRWISIAGAEWIVRLVQEPRRLVKRYWGNGLFLLRDLARQCLRVSRGHPDRVHRMQLAESEGILRVSFFGHLGSSLFQECEILLPRARSSDVLLDLSGAESLDYDALGFIARLKKECSDSRRKLVIRAEGAVSISLAAARMDRVVPVVPDVDRALGLLVWANS